MATATSLNDYFAGQGQALPSLTSRAQLYSAHGGQGNYMGTVQQNSYLLGKLQGGSSPTGTAVSFNAAPAAPAPTTVSGYVAANQAPVTSAQQALTAAQAGYNPTEVYNKAAADQGLPEEQQTVQQLLGQLKGRQDALSNLDPQIQDRLKTLGTTVTEAQRARWLNNESTPITKQINDIANAKSIEDAALNTKQSNVNNAVTLAGQTNDAKIKSLSDALSNAQSNFSTGEDAFKTDLSARQALAAAKTKAATGSSSASSTLKTTAGKAFNVTPAALSQSDKILQTVPSDNPNAKADNYFSQNELSQAVKRAMSQYGLDQSNAEALIQQTIDAKGYTVLNDWNTYSKADQQKILSGKY